jgi:predicted amidophosphoribosyltransferase
MVEPLIHFNKLQRMGYGQSSRALKALCDRYGIPVVRLNKRQYALRESDYRLLLERSMVREAA